MSSVSSHAVHQRIHHAVQTTLEFGLYQQWLKSQDVIDYKNVKSKDLRDCVANKIVFPDHDVKHPNLYHYRFLFALVAGLFLLTALLLHAEKKGRQSRAGGKGSKFRRLCSRLLVRRPRVIDSTNLVVISTGE